MARTMNLKVIKKEAAQKIYHLQPLLDNNIRHEHTSWDALSEVLKNLSCSATKNIRTTMLTDKQKQEIGKPDLSKYIDPVTYDQHLAGVQQRAVDALYKTKQAINPKGYISVKICPTGDESVPDEHLCIACDGNGEGYHLINMNNPSLPILSAKTFNDITNYMQAFLGARRATEVTLTGFLAKPNAS